MTVHSRFNALLGYNLPMYPCLHAVLNKAIPASVVDHLPFVSALLLHYKRSLRFGLQECKRKQMHRGNIP